MYFLGTPSSVNVVDLGGCAVIFHDTAGGPEFAGADVKTSQGHCSDIIEQNCLDRLGELATNTSGSNSCSELENSLKNNTFSECADMAGSGKGLGQFTVTSLSGLSPISQSDNVTSDCWPITPKSDALTDIADDTAMVGKLFFPFIKAASACTNLDSLRETSHLTP